jgi:tetrahydromethanopterin S-methyltransferase subunit G
MVGLSGQAPQDAPSSSRPATLSNSTQMVNLSLHILTFPFEQRKSEVEGHLCAVGFEVGRDVGLEVGADVGADVGVVVGASLGSFVGAFVGAFVGSSEG